MIVKAELNIPLEYKDEPLFHYIVKNYNLVLRIIEASFSTEMGWAIVSLEGTEKEINRLFDFLKEKNIGITIE